MPSYSKNFEALRIALWGKSIAAVHHGSRVVMTSDGDIIEVDTAAYFKGIHRTLFLADQPNEPFRQVVIIDARLRIAKIEEPFWGKEEDKFYILVETYGVSQARTEPHYLPLMASYEYGFTDFYNKAPEWVHPVKVTTGESILKEAKAESELYGHTL